MKKTYTVRATDPTKQKYNKAICHDECYAFITYDAETHEQLFTAYLYPIQGNVYHNDYCLWLCDLTVDTKQDLIPYVDDLRTYLRDAYIFDEVFKQYDITIINYYKVYDQSKLLHRILEDPDKGYILQDLEHSYVIQTPLFYK